MANTDDPRRMFRLTVAIVAAITLARIAVLIASPLNLYPDEAQYWWWAQTPDLGYFSKPPLIAWIIRFSTIIFGNSEWAIRLPIPLLHAGTSLFVFAIARTIRPLGARLAFWCAIAYLTLPGVSYSSGLASTDAPLLFFWALALLAFLHAIEKQSWRWALLCGAALGLGVLAKYAMLFFVVAVVVAAVARRDVRRAVLSWRGAGAALTAALVIAPNVAWNATHAFATVLHTRGNAEWSRAHFGVVHLLAFMAGQFGVFGPVLMAAWLVGLWRLIRGDKPATGVVVLVSMSAVPFALIMAQSFISEANANWAATAYVAALPIALAEILDRWPRIALQGSFALHGAVLVLLGAILIRPVIADRLGVGNVFKREEGWHDLADAVRSEFIRGKYDVVAADNRSVTAELLYYLRPGAPPVRIWDPDTASHNHFDMTMRLTKPAGHVLLVLSPEDEPQIGPTFESVKAVATVKTPVGGRHERVLCLYDAHFYRGPVTRP
jgi:4-amino-4-deoxy-L-arabinose transferase-like glycosyltransferase